MCLLPSTVQTHCTSVGGSNYFDTNMSNLFGFVKGVNISKQLSSKLTYIPKAVYDDHTLCYCGFEKVISAIECRFCSHPLRKKIKSSISKGRINLRVPFQLSGFQVGEIILVLSCSVEIFLYRVVAKAAVSIAVFGEYVKKLFKNVECGCGIPQQNFESKLIKFKLNVIFLLLENTMTF